MTTLDPLAIEPILRRLRSLRGRARRRLWLDGAARLLALAVLLILLSMALDRSFRLDQSQRAICLVLALAAMAGVAHRRLLRPILRPIPDDDLALRVEARHPSLGQALVTALQLSRIRDHEARGMSPTLVHAAIDQGLRRQSAVDYNLTLDSARQRHSLLLGGSAAVVLLIVMVALSALSPAFLRIWAARNLLLLNTPWPFRTTLLLVGHPDTSEDIVLPRGDDWMVHVRVAGELPTAVWLDIDPDSSSARTTERLTSDNDPRSLRALTPNLLEPFRFRLRGGDYRSDWRRVRLLDRPALDSLSLAVAPPAYTGLRPGDLPTGQTAYDVLYGSDIAVRALATKPLRAVAVTQVTAARPTPRSPVSSDRPPDAAATNPAASATAPAAPPPVEARIDPEQPTRFTFELSAARFAPDDAGTAVTFAIDMTDTDGLVTRQPARLTLRLRADRKPDLRAALVGISGMVTPRVAIPIDLSASDDLSIVALRLTHGLTLPTAEPDAAPAPAPAPTTRPLSDLGAQLPAPRITGRTVFDTADLQLPIGATLWFSLAASDANTLTGPGVQASPSFFVRVVSDEELRTELLRREQEQRQEFERVLFDQETLGTDAKALIAAGSRSNVTAAPEGGASGGGGGGANDRAEFTRLQRRQRQIAERCAAVARAFSMILLEAQNNRLTEEGQDVAVRLRGRIIDPLNILAEQTIPLAARRLDLAGKTADSDADRPALLTAAAADQDRILVQMRSVLAAMVKWEGYQEAVNLLHEIVKAQTDVQAATTQAQQSRIRDIFENP